MKYSAPWSRMVILVTVGIIVLLTGVGIVVPGTVMTWLIWLMIPALALFGVRGYSLDRGDLVIHYMVHRKRISLHDLRSVRVAPGVTSGSIRLFGNGGVFGFTGHFRNSELGNYRAWVTDPERAVVLTFEDRTCVVTPDRPNLFVEELRGRTGVEPAPPA